MARKGQTPKRKILPDPKYNSEILAKLINYIMRKGKKSTAEKICYGAFDVVKEKTKEQPLDVFNKAMENVKPILETRSRRVGGATYQVPVEVKTHRKIALALRWLVDFSKERAERTMVEKLAGEIMDAALNKGASVKKRENTHKMAEANRAFAHYRW